MEDKDSKSRQDKVILTGQYVGVVEEFLPDKESTYTQNGKIFATKSGLINYDLDKRKINIKTHQEPDRKTVEINDIVLGTILFLRKYSVGLNFYTINRKLHFNSYYFGNIHVSQISNRYIEKISDAFQKTDIIRAKVIKKKTNEYNLSTIGKNLGVIHSDCSICGTPLNKVGFDKLRCPMCGNMENKKIANDYRDVSYTLRY
jgi:exosome complex component CSL4